MRLYWITCIILIIFKIKYVLSIEPITSGIGVGIAFTIGLLSKQMMSFLDGDSCLAANFNITHLRHSMLESLFGQHIVQRVILSSVPAFVRNENPRKPLVLSFHGSTGTGKTYVSSLIAESLYPKGKESKNYNFFIGTNEFSQFSKIEESKARLHKKLIEGIQKCPRPMFVFDEIDKMTPGILNEIIPYLDYHESVGGYDFRKAIFIFISNTGSKVIFDTMIKKWQEGEKREAVKYWDTEQGSVTGIFNEAGVFMGSEIIKKYVIDYYIPFLPLEKEHVIKCILASKPNLSKEHVDEIVNSLVFKPEDSKKFSTNGCKAIINKVAYYDD